jgi:hypothetical protein
MIVLPMQIGKHVWAAYGGKFEWALVLSGCPTRRSDLEYLRGTLALAIEVIELGMLAEESRFTGFDDIAWPPKQKDAK